MAYALRKDNILNTGILVVLLLVIVYYSYYISFTSERISKMNDELSTLRETFITVSIDYDKLKNKTGRLRKDNLDLELLDERARSVLGYMRQDERLDLHQQVTP